MNDQQHWQEQNTQYLSVALAWLRLRLERLAQHKPPPPTPGLVTPPHPTQPPQPAQTTQRRGWFGRAPAPVAPAPALPAPASPTTTTTNGDLAEYARQMAGAETNEDTLPALVMLSQRLQLTRFEREVLLLCIAMELDTRIAALCARTQDDASKTYPTFALALAL
ncbi:MAG TPA: hypothetical protein VK134_02345, partial [Ktedonobacteraceae bacterium]|nr:hypothetical protein [Ktedonobacteraceae bacterium]